MSGVDLDGLEDQAVECAEIIKRLQTEHTGRLRSLDQYEGRLARILEWIDEKRIEVDAASCVPPVGFLDSGDDWS